jgi:hypothetical protein
MLATAGVASYRKVIDLEALSLVRFPLPTGNAKPVHG